jgi:hypothetical protein
MSDINYEVEKKPICTCDLGYGIQSAHCKPCKVHNIYYPAKRFPLSDEEKKIKSAYERLQSTKQ